MPKVLDIKQNTYASSTYLRSKEKLFTFVREFSLTYVVMGDHINQTENDILAASGIPPVFYPLRGAYCKDRTATEEERIINPMTGELAGLWEVKCDFSSEVDVDNDGKEPEARTPRVRWTGETEDEPLEWDAIDARPVQTTAGEPIVSTTPVAYPVLEIQRYEIYPFDPDVILDYSNRTNKTTFYGSPPGTAWMMPPSAEEPEIIEGRKYSNVTYRIKFKIKKVVIPMLGNKTALTGEWMFRPRNRGYLYIPDDKTDKKDAIVNVDAHRNPVQCDLDEDGHKLKKGEDPVYLGFNRVPEAEFNNLSLGPF
jgi:hypothetical protein